VSKIAFLGIGNMGAPMATRLLNAGHDITVWNRSAPRTDALARAGARVAATPADAAGGVEFVITMLATPEALDDVLFGSDGLAPGLSAGQTWVDMSTVGPDAFRSAAARMPDGVAAVDAPVRGSIPEATGGGLHVYVGASREDFDRVRPVLEVLGDLHLVGAPGAGAAMKLVVNTTLVAAMVATAEALALGEVFGLDEGRVLDVLAESPVAAIVRAKRANLEAGHYPASFALPLAAKDLRLAAEAADRAGVVLRTAESVRRWLDEAADQGGAAGADLDFSAVAATVLRRPLRA
jgi:3-hydroxyisobutyrate dehydrogenase